MSVNSVSSNAAVPTPPKAPPKAVPAEAAEATRGGKVPKKEGDMNDAGATTKASAPKPVSNMQGQVIGRTLNVTA